MGKADVVIIGIVICSFIMNCIALPFMPSLIATHWDHRGLADGYMQKTFGLFMLNFIFAMMAVIFVVIPKIDQVKRQIEKISSYYYTFTIWAMLLFLFVNVHIVLWNSGVLRLNPLTVINVSIVFLVAGMIICKIRTKNRLRGDK